MRLCGNHSGETKDNKRPDRETHMPEIGGGETEDRARLPVTLSEVIHMSMHSYLGN